MLLAFFVAKSSTYKCYNSALGVQAISLSRAEADSGCAIMVRKGVGGSTVRLWCGTEWMEPLRDYGAERGKVGEPCDYGSERIWCSRVILWCGTEMFLGGDIMVRNGVGLRVFHGIF